MVKRRAQQEVQALVERLQRYFSAPLTEAALERYDDVLGKNWSLEHKCDLYEHARTAFESVASDGERQQAFDYVYTKLRGYWQVFRNAESYWSPQEIYARLPQAAASFCRLSGRTLSSDLDGECREIVAAVAQLRELKQLRSGEFSEMAASKFLHFFNPSLFPIYDLEFVWRKVFRSFRQDYRDFRTQQGWTHDAVGAEFYARYILWGSHVMRSSPPDFMPRFSEWFRHKGAGRGLPIERYYATAFEMVAVGAALLHDG